MPVPDFVWKAALYLFAAIGIIVVLLIWKNGRVSLDGKGPGRDRRNGDPVIQQLLEQNREAFNMHVEGMREVVNGLNGVALAIRGLAGDVQAVSKKQDGDSQHHQASFRGIHDRLDKLVHREA